MPQKDGTGPMGQGPLTGRQMGNCQPKNRFWRQAGTFCRRFCQGPRGWRQTSEDDK